MSNVNPENPQPNPSPWQGESASRQPGDAYPDNPYMPPTPEVNSIQPNWTQVADALSSIAVMNARVRESALGVTEALRAQRQELERINDYTSRRRTNSEGVREVEQQTTDLLSEQAQAHVFDPVASQQELERTRADDVQMRMRQLRSSHVAREQLAAYRSMSAPEQLSQLRQRNIITGEGDEMVARIGDQIIPGEQITQAMEAEQPDETQRNILNTLEGAFQRSVTSEVTRQAPRTVSNLLDAIEQSGIRQLRYGQLTPQDILRSVTTLAGNAGLSIAQAQETNATWQAWQERQAAAEAAGEEFDEPEPARPQTQTLAHRIATSPSLAGRVISTLGGIAEIAQPVGQAIAVGQMASGAFGQMYGSIYQAPERSGQLTGEGWSAGLGARWDAFKLGANPFDMISGGQASEIIQNVRERGFTGGSTMDVAEGIRDVVNDLGISISQASEYFTDAMRKGGLSVDQVRQQMAHFDDNAKALNMNINDYTAQILQNTQSVREMGAGAAAPGISQALTAAVPVAFRGGAGQQALEQLFTRNRGYITAALNQQGIPANILTVSSQRYARQGFQALDQIVLQDAQTARTQLGPNASWNDIANWMSQAGPHTQGMDPTFLQQYLKSISSGQGVSNQLSIRRAEQTYANRVNAGARMAPNQMSDAQLQALGISRQYHVAGRGEGFETYTRNGERIDPTKPYNNMTADQIAAARQAALAQLAPHTLTDAEKKMFQQHINDRSWDFAGQLENITREKQRQVGPQVNLPGVIISLKPGMESKMFQLQTERRTANNTGTLPANQNPSRVVSP